MTFLGKGSSNKHYEIVLIILSSFLVFRSIGTFLIIGFLIYSLLNFRSFSFNSLKCKNILLIAIPFLLDIIFVWNNSSFSETIKHGEKRVSLLLLPLLIIGSRKTIDFYFLFKWYARTFTLILLFCLIRFIILYNDLFTKYIQGVDLWEMGYKLAESVNTHGPALNMHVAFAVVINFYFLLRSFRERKPLINKLFSIGYYLVSVLMLLYVNTRLALINAFICCLFTLVIFYKNKWNLKKILLRTGALAVVLLTLLFTFSLLYPHTTEKFTRVTFAHIDKVGELDKIENPEAEVFNGLVTRLSIWKSAGELGIKELPFGTGAADGKSALTRYYKATDQNFLHTFAFPAHNQFLDFLIKFGVIGFIGLCIYFVYILKLGLRSGSIIAVVFFWIFFTSNLVDDFLIRYDGIVFAAFWLSIFASLSIVGRSGKLQRDF